jgi:hypothetical protein
VFIKDNGCSVFGKRRFLPPAPVVKKLVSDPIEEGFVEAYHVIL